MKRFHALIALCIFLTACNLAQLPAVSANSAEATVTPTPFMPLPPTPDGAAPSLPTATSTVFASPTTAAPISIPSTDIPTIGLWLDPALPDALTAQLRLPPELTLISSPDSAALQLKIGEERLLTHWVYALAAPFPTIEDGISFKELHQIWKGEEASRVFGPLLMDTNTLAVFTAYWGIPASGAYQEAPTAELLEQAWNDRPSWALVPFEALEPRWKVLQIDAVSPLQKDFVVADYPLSIPISLTGEAELTEAIYALHGPATESPLIASNREPDKLTNVVMTGVTALVRATAYAMEQQGVLYPAQDIGPWLRQADITHISNEVPFAEDCPFPNPVQEGMIFCSDPRYINLLENVGTDVVELTGDHFGDWGSAAMLYTLELYDEEEWLYYGGGKNLNQGRKPVTLEHNGNKIAFIGCNGKGGGYATASADNPGAVVCDFDWIHKQIESLSAEGYRVIATFQHFEYYAYAAQPDQIEDFEGMAEAGAVIVSGSQAHQPQTIDFQNNAFIHYGLGNLFFDQYGVSEATRQAFIDRHIFYDGKYISTELLTIMFVDYARARPMTTEERQQLLEAVFAANGW
ncbi:MAG: CapA family protein [Anaerolineales bacterium]|nr:CapA family protein [Anaerolineales bacterium]